MDGAVIAPSALFPALEANQGLATTVALVVALATAVGGYLRSLWVVHRERIDNSAALKRQLQRGINDLNGWSSPAPFGLAGTLDAFQKHQQRTVRTLRAASRSRVNTAAMIIDLEEAASIIEETTFDCTSEPNAEWTKKVYISCLEGAIRAIDPVKARK